MTPRRQRRRRSNLTGADIVAIILATGVALVLCLIIIGTIVQILHNAPGVPEIQLSENATQIIISGMGGIIGVLGGYIGYRMHQNHSRENYMAEEQTLPAPPTGTPTPPGEAAPPPEANPSNPPTRPTVPPPDPDTRPPEEREPTENDDKTDVQPRPEPKEGEEGDPHGSPLDDPEDERFVRRDPEEPAA